MPQSSITLIRLNETKFTFGCQAFWTIVPQGILAAHTRAHTMSLPLVRLGRRSYDKSLEDVRFWPPRLSRPPLPQQRSRHECSFVRGTSFIKGNSRNLPLFLSLFFFVLRGTFFSGGRVLFFLRFFYRVFFLVQVFFLVLHIHGLMMCFLRVFF